MSEINILVSESLHDVVSKGFGAVKDHVERHGHVYKACIGAACGALAITSRMYPNVKPLQNANKVATAALAAKSAYDKYK